MRIKKYIAKTAAEGRKKIKEDLGDDAVILSMRNIIKPPNNESFIEFVVAVENNHSVSPKIQAFFIGNDFNRWILWVCIISIGY